jgi:phosphatidylinositol alpha-1,6-mannosyltransferase
MARVAAEEIGPDAIPIRGLTLGDDTRPNDLPFPVDLAKGSRLRFWWSASWSARRCSHFVYDGTQLAQLQQMPFLRSRPMLTFMHGIEVWDQAKPGYLRSARQAKFLLANSEFTRRKADETHGGLGHAKVCWLATEEDQPAPQRPPSSGPPEVVIVGRLADERYKGHRELIACWPQVTSAVPDAVLRIIGQGSDAPALQALAAHSSAAKNIVFQGFVSEAELPRFYAQATVFAMPSRGEGFGLVYIEAMRHGLPVLASVHDAAPEVVVDGQTGSLVNLDRPGELAEAIIALLRDRDRARQLGAQGRQRWEQHFRYSAFRERFRPLLRQFLTA